jgi:hypothetical protein
VIAAAVAIALLAAATAQAAGPVRFTVALGGDARPGASTSLTLRLRVSDDLPPVTEVRLLTPAGIDLSSSGLGMATCVRPDSELLDVMHTLFRRPCPGNSLMGTGRATAQLRFDREEVYDGGARLALYAGEPVGDKPGLLVLATTSRPMRTQLSYQGYLYIPPPEFGVGLAIKVQPIPRPLLGAPMALSAFRLTVGAAALRYVRTSHGRRVSYRPRAIPLPQRCPTGGFRFRAVLRFGGGQRVATDARVPCPGGGT